MLPAFQAAVAGSDSTRSDARCIRGCSLQNRMQCYWPVNRCSGPPDYNWCNWSSVTLADSKLAQVHVGGMAVRQQRSTEVQAQQPSGICVCCQGAHRGDVRINEHQEHEEQVITLIAIVKFLYCLPQRDGTLCAGPGQGGGNLVPDPEQRNHERSTMVCDTVTALHGYGRGHHSTVLVTAAVLRTHARPGCLSLQQPWENARCWAKLSSKDTEVQRTGSPWQADPHTTHNSSGLQPGGRVQEKVGLRQEGVVCQQVHHSGTPHAICYKNLCG